MVAALTVHAQELKPLTLEDLNFGGTNYHNMVPKTRYTTWWGDELVHLDTEECFLVNKSTGKESQLFTLSELNQWSGMKLRHLYNLSFPENGKSLVWLNDGNERMLFDWKHKKAIWKGNISMAKGAQAQDFNSVSKALAYVKDNQLHVIDEHGNAFQKLDYLKTKQVFDKQLGPRFYGFENMQPHRKAMFALIGVIVLIFSFRLKESLSVENRLQGSIFSTFLTFGVIIKNRLFMSYVGIQSFLLGSMFAYIAASPFIFQSFYGLSAFIFSLCFGANGAALVIGANVGGKLPNRQALAIGVLAFVVAALYTIAVLIIQPYWLFVEIGFFAMLLLMGMTFPAISTLAMESERQYAGSRSQPRGIQPRFR